MDVHEDDISILPDTEEDQTTIAEDGTGLAPFRLNSVDIPASTHALQSAYRDLKKRYNESEQRYKALRRHSRENSLQRMAFENSFMSGENCPPFAAGMGEQGAAAMADQTCSVEDMAKQGIINHLTRQVTFLQTKNSILEEELKHSRQKFDDFREKYEACLQERDRLTSELTNKSMELEEWKVRNSNVHVVAELKDIIRTRNQEVANLNQTVVSKDLQLSRLHDQFEMLKISSKSSPVLTEVKTVYPSSFPSQTGSGVVSMAEFRAVKEHMKQCQENMVKLRRVVEQQNELIRTLQADQLSKDSKEWDIVNATDFTTAKDVPNETESTVRKVRDFADSCSYRDPAYGDISHRADLTVDQALSPRSPNERDFTQTSDIQGEAANWQSFNFQDASPISHHLQSARLNLQRLTQGLEDPYSVRLPVPCGEPGLVTLLPPVSWPRREPVQSTEETSNSPGSTPPHERISPRPQGFASPDRDTQTAAGHQASRDCPVCGLNFSNLTMADFQTHVFECYDNTESGEIRAAQAGRNTGIAVPSEDRHDSSLLRVCPVCSSEFHSDIPQSLYERHVYEHFGEPPNIVDDFDVLNP